MLYLTHILALYGSCVSCSGISNWRIPILPGEQRVCSHGIVQKYGATGASNFKADLTVFIMPYIYIQK